MGDGGAGGRIAIYSDFPSITGATNVAGGNGLNAGLLGTVTTFDAPFNLILVPEPHRAVLLLAGMFAIALRRRR